MPVGRPRVGRFSLRIPVWLHEELALEAYRRNVSLNQLCFEALVARRALVKKPQVQQTLEKLDQRRTQNRDVISREVSATVVAVVKTAPDRPKPDATGERILEALRRMRRPVDVEDIHRETGMDCMTLHACLLRLWLQKWVRKVPGERYQLESNTTALLALSG